ncbi:MAG: hypothetical protein IJV06_08875 [Bacteroidaceae bacterium]|nr:hypothetical protein [Bacteroidaceae bacterium]
MKLRFFTLYSSLFTLLIIMGACSSDDDDTIKQLPTEEQTEGLAETPAYLTQGTASRPTTWIAPRYENFELSMSVQVELGDTLAYYQSEQDLMCATIDGDVRAVTSPKSTMGFVYFPLTIANGGGGEKSIDLHYYCDRLHRIFTMKDWATFDASTAPIGDSGIYRPMFTTTF